MDSLGSSSPPWQREKRDVKSSKKPAPIKDASDNSETHLQVSDPLGSGSSLQSVGGEEKTQQEVFLEERSIPRFESDAKTNTSQNRGIIKNAVSSLLSRAASPFAKTEKKRAHDSALFYSECFLNGVTPNAADDAARAAHGQFDRWWMKTAYHAPPPPPIPALPNDENSGLKCSEEDDTTHNQSCKRSSVAAVSDKGKADTSHKRSRIGRRCQIRDIIDDETIRRRQHQPAGDYAAEVSILPGDTEQKTEPSRDRIEGFSIQCIPNLATVTKQQVKHIRNKLIRKLKKLQGDISSPNLKCDLEILLSLFMSSNIDAREVDTESFPFEIDGPWLTISQPSYSECLGRTLSGDPIYCLGRMSFDMFRPTGLRCSIQGIFNTINKLDPAAGEVPSSIPRSLRKEMNRSREDGNAIGLRTYNVVVAFTIESGQTVTGKLLSNETLTNDVRVVSKPVRGIMTNFGYMIPDPSTNNRFSIWYTGGSIEVNDEVEDIEQWKIIFDDEVIPKRDVKEYARVLASKFLLGAQVPDKMEEDGTMSYSLKNPIGGHGSAFCDVLYMDETLRIMRGHHGSLYAFTKLSSLG